VLFQSALLVAWGLRKYSVKPLIWGGDSGCEHKWVEHSRYWDNRAASLMATEGTADFSGKKDARGQLKTNFCRLCRAWRGELGLEPRPELYLDHMMLVMGEVWRVLRNDGVCFVNLGDSYAAGKCGRGDMDRNTRNTDGRNPDNASLTGCDFVSQRKAPDNIKPKSLCLIPQKFAIRCQEAGWIIRSEIIWAKPNPMPESVRDRPTRSHEQVWLMVKRGRYYWDQDAVAEPQVEHERIRRLREKDQGLNTVYNIAQDGKTGIADQSQTGTVRNVAVRQRLAEKGTRNIRDVWTMATRPTPEAHFATWPMELCDKMIRAASKLGDIVLDPFCGTAQTVLKAEELNRIGVGMDLSWEYISEIAKVKYDRLLQRELYVH